MGEVVHMCHNAAVEDPEVVQQRGEISNVTLGIWDPAIPDIQSGASYLSQGFEDNVLGNSSG